MKKKLWWILCLSMLLVFGSTLTAHAAGDSISEATSISLGTTYSGTISEDNTTDVYKFTLSTSGKLTLTSTHYMSRLKYYLYDASGDSLWNTTCYIDSNTGQGTVDKSIYLTSGTYYLSVVYSYGYGSYSFKTSFVSAGESFSEPQGGNNNSISAADAISLGTTYKGQIAQNDTVDIYQFSLSSSGKITLSSTNYIDRLKYYIYDASGETVWNTTCYINSSTSQGTLDETINLTSGTYYLGIVYSYGHGNYSFKISFSSAGESFTETQGGNNNSFSEADSISLNTSYKGQIALNDEKDFYQFKTKKDNAITVKVSASGMSRLYFGIYDADGNAVWTYTSYSDSSTGKITLSESVTLSAGTYYFGVIYSYGRGNYSFKLKSAFTKSNVTLSKTSFTYTGKKKTPTITVVNAAGTTLKEGTDYTLTWSSSSRKSIGKYTVTIKGKGDYAGSSVKKTFKIKPKQVSVKSVKSSSSKKLTVKWSKVSGSVKYQIAYKVKGGSWKYKTVSSKTYSKTLSGLKSGKTYYVKVRAVKTVDGTTYHGSWSSTTKVKVK